jgi:neutrophil factor 2
MLQRDGLAALADAIRVKAIKEHEVIDACLRDEGRGYTIFSVVRLPPAAASQPARTDLPTPQPAGVIFRPPAAKLKNITAKDYLGKAVRFSARLAPLQLTG